jgi:hypothetical protein
MVSVRLEFLGKPKMRSSSLPIVLRLAVFSRFISENPRSQMEMQVLQRRVQW